MIWTYLTIARGFLARVPWQIWAFFTLLLTAWLWGNHRYSQGVADTEAKQDAVVAQAVAQARKADEAAQIVAKAHQDAVEAGNAKAREAAKRSDDPLKAGMEALR